MALIQANQIPAMDTLTRDTTVIPKLGFLIYNIDLFLLQAFDGSNWQNVSSPLVTMQLAYDNNPVVDMDSNISLRFNKSTGGLAFEIVEAGDLTAVKAHRAVIAEYGGPGGPFFYAKTTSQGAVSDEIGSFYIECLDNTNTQKTFKNWATSIVNPNPTSFTTKTVFSEKVDDADVDCFAFGIENLSYRTINMQSNPISNAGTITATQVSTPGIDLQGGSLSNSGFIETQSLTCSNFAQLNQIEQTNPFASGPLIYNIFDSAPTAGNTSYKKAHFANNDALVSFEFMRDEIVTQNITAGSETAQRRFYCANSGTIDEYFRLEGNANQLSVFKTFDMQGNSIVACQALYGNAGSIDFQNIPGELKISTFGTNVLNLSSSDGLLLTNTTSGNMIIEHQGAGNKIDLNGSLLPGELSITSNGGGVIVQEITTGNNIGITNFSSGMVTNSGITQIRNTDAAQDLNIVKQNGGNINLDCVASGFVNILNTDLNLNANNIISVSSINGLTPVGGLSSGISNSAILTASTTEQSILANTYVGSRTAPANTFQQGDAFTAVLAGNFSSANGDTLTLRLKGGPTGATVLSSIVIPLNGSSGTFFELEIDFVVRQIGAATVANLAINYDFSYNQSSGGNFQGERRCEVNSTTFDTTVDNVLNITAQFSSTSANNSIETLLSTLGKSY